MHEATYVVGDIHGHRDELRSALRAEDIVDAGGDWCAGGATVWFLGDFMDRGPDGVGVVDDVMRLSDQARDAGGAVHALLGNHEVLALGTHLFGDTDIPFERGGPRNFWRTWLRNGGVPGDQMSLTDEHVQWLRTLPALALADDHLLMHSDTIDYIDWGTTVPQINEAVREALAGDDPTVWWQCWVSLCGRFAFRGPEGPTVADRLLQVLGGERIVHGHSVIAEHLGVPPSQIEGPDLYAEDRVLGVDGGVFVGGPCLVVPLPYHRAQPRERAS